MTDTFNLSEMRDEDGNIHQQSIFWIQASTASARAIVFAAEAKVAYSTEKYIWAAISCYYCLFHLSVSLAFIVPECVHQKMLTKLITERQGGSSDPTSLVTHRYVPNFLERCEKMGLTFQLRKSLKRNRKMRNFVNYRPTVAWEDGVAIVKTREFTLQDLEDAVEKLESLLSESLSWAYGQNEAAELVAFASTASLIMFLDEEDLLYRKWCSAEVLAEAERLRQSLPILIERSHEPD